MPYFTWRDGPSGPLFRLTTPISIRYFHHLAEKEEGIITGDETGDLNLAQRFHLIGLRIFYMHSKIY